MAYLRDEDLRVLKRLCIILAAGVAIFGIIQFINRVLRHNLVMRLEGVFSNANSMGIFCVIGWTALLNCTADAEDSPRGNKIRALLKCMEPAFLAALTLTLSMGSCCALGAAYITLVLSKLKKCGIKQTLDYAAFMLAKICMGIGLGLLLYLSAARSNAPLLCIPVFIYICVFLIFWNKFEEFLINYKCMSAALAIMLIVIAAILISVRPSAVETFADRVGMMRSGLGYMMKHPLLGVGVNKWRLLNLTDADKYYAVNKIHNTLISVAVEMGLAAAAALVVICVRGFLKKQSMRSRPGLVAFCLHSMIDTVFFINKFMVFLIIEESNPQEGGTRLNAVTARMIFAVFAALFTYHLIL
uniref:O-antigen ligase-related domain-containing protein n=1 Tax=uncultured Bacillota bacterium TaxID=344338 RepID=A0A650ENN1_9FIRM|nr:hypothetical protein Firmicute1046_3490 [uncultured Firmicutes bacterium]